MGRRSRKKRAYEFKTTPDALPHYTDDKNLKLFTKHKIYTEIEIASRKKYHWKNTAKQ